MIEVEKKFVLTPEIKKQIQKVAKFVVKKTQRDIYFDKSDYSLLQKDWYLRERNGNFELKTVVPNTGQRLHTYNEIENFKEIAKILKLPWDETVKPTIFLQTQGFVPFMDITTHREKYQLDNIALDLDECTFGFNLFEAEIMVPDESAMALAETTIMSVLQKYNITAQPMRHGKGWAYLEKYNPSLHEQVLAWHDVKME